MIEFNAKEIKLMTDVTIPHTELAARFGVGVGSVREYRQTQLGIYLRGFNYDYADLLNKVDWTRPVIDLARELKVSPDTVAQWQRRATRVRRGPGVLTDEQRAEIMTSNERSVALAERFGVDDSTIRHVWMKNGRSQKPGPRMKVFTDYPETNWNQPANRLVKELGVCWVVADRLRTEALLHAEQLPVIETQMPLPGFESDALLPPEFEGIDWTENTSMLATHLGLDNDEVLRLKSLARKQRRRNKSL